MTMYQKAYRIFMAKSIKKNNNRFNFYKTTAQDFKHTCR